MMDTLSGGEEVLNLFAYTGGATLAAAKAGARLTHVDAAKSMVAWAKENAELSGLRGAPIRYMVDDCMKFVLREQRRGKKYEGIIMDPPSYGRGSNGRFGEWKRICFRWLRNAQSCSRTSRNFSSLTPTLPGFPRW